MNRVLDSSLSFVAAIAAAWSAASTGVVALNAVQTGFDPWLYTTLGILAVVQLLAAAMTAFRRDIAALAILALASSPLAALDWANMNFAHSIRDYSGLIAGVATIVALSIVVASRFWRRRQGDN